MSYQFSVFIIEAFFLCVQFAGNVVELSFFRPEVGSDMQPVPVPAKEILKHPNLLQELQNTVPELKIQQLTHEVRKLQVEVLIDSISKLVLNENVHVMIR